MPRHLVPRKLGVHRAACFALYRALLRQKHNLQLDKSQQRRFCSPIRVVFKRNSKLQSLTQVSTALQLGYETLEGLQDGARRQRVLNRIFELATPPIRSEWVKDLPSSPRTKTGRPKRDAILFPGATRTLARPFLNISGRRHVPVLINANRVPFLRLKKPQPPFLSRIIRDTVKARELRIIRANGLTSELLIAEHEDGWDEILYEHFGLRDGEESWVWEVKRALEHNHKMQVEGIQKRADISAKMYAIVEQEKALAKEEKLRIRDEKHKARKARRLARRGLTEQEIQEKLYPQIKQTIIKDGPAETDEEERRGQEEADQPKMEHQWRKRGDKYKTSEELRLLYEASLRPKTDEEVAKIKEARAKRKEEESLRKAEKKQRKDENAASWEQKLNNQARNSTNERLGSEKSKDLDKNALSLKPPALPRKQDEWTTEAYNDSLKLSPILEELQKARDLASDAPSKEDKTGPHNL